MPPKDDLPPDLIPDMTLPERGSTPPQAREEDAHVKKRPVWEKPTAAGQWKVGDRVLAPWEPSCYYVGAIQEFDKSRALIQFDDGDAGWVFLDQIRRLAVERGQKVMSRRKMGALFYAAEILDLRGDEVLVGFEDGAAEEWTRIAALRFVIEDDSDGAEPTKIASNQVFLDSLKNGSRVWAPWAAGALFVGAVHDIQGDEAHIHFDDGDQGWVRLDQLLPFEPFVGMFVVANWKMAGNYYPGVITKISGERIHIRYDDGDEEWVKPAALAMPSQTGGPDARPTHVARRWNAANLWWIALVAIGLLSCLWRFGCDSN